MVRDLGITNTNPLAPYLNQIQLIGRAGHDPECCTLSDGTRRTRLRLYQNRGNEAPTSEPLVHTLVAWDRIADQLYAGVGRGDRLFVQGTLTYRKFTCNGQTQVRSEIQVRQFAVLQRGRIAPVIAPAATAAEPASRYEHD